MAWLSVGSSNHDLVCKMQEHSVFKEGRELLQSFLRTDRGDFVHQEDRLLAYQDRPYKRAALHISAPHMYVTVLEALSLQRGQSFLNVGSGSGYLSCLAASLLGPNGVSHGIEISESNVSFSLQAIQKWKEKNPDLYSKQEVVSIIHGNCFDIDVAASADCCKYDRIYVGAGCPEGRKEFFYHLLSINGILVMPIDERNQLIKVLKLSPTLYSTAHVSYVHFAPLIEASFHDDELMAVHNNDSNSESIPIVDQNLLGLLHNVDLSTVSHFKSPVPKAGRNKVMLPTLLWAPEKYRHLQFPTDFRHVVKMVLIAANRWLPELPVTSSSQNAATKRASCSTLPVAIWFVVFTFASRDWFQRKPSDLEVLQAELVLERKLRSQMEKRLQEADRARKAAERERDAYKATIARTISRTVQFPNGTSRRLRSETNTFDSASETDSNSNGDDSSSDNNALGANNQNLDQQNDLDYMQNDHTMSNNSHFYHNANLSEVSNNADYAVESAQQDVISADNNNDNAIGMEVYHTNEFNEEQGGEEDDREAELEDFDDDGLYSASTRSNDTDNPEDNFETIPRLDFISQLTAFISNGHK